MVGRNMTIGVTGSDLMVRPGPEQFRRRPDAAARQANGLYRKADEGLRFCGVRGHRHGHRLGRMGGTRSGFRQVVTGQVDRPKQTI